MRTAALHSHVSEAVVSKQVTTGRLLKISDEFTLPKVKILCKKSVVPPCRKGLSKLLLQNMVYQWVGEEKNG